MTEMTQACDSAGWHWPLAFTKRLANGPAAEETARIIAGPTLEAFSMRLLSKCEAPTDIAVLLALAKSWSKACFHKLPAYDVARNKAHVRFCLGCSCVEHVTATRLFKGCCEWGA